ncbi:MAG: hypothetical protein ABIV94_09710 [Acidimicrobiales bacterium]
MSGLDVSRLTPADCVAALRSYPRRFRAALSAIGDDDSAEERAHRVGTDGRSAVDHVDHVVRAFDALGQAVHQILVDDSPTLTPAVLDDSAREHPVGSQQRLDSVLDAVTAECGRLADVVERVDTDAWTRTGLVGDRKVTALDVVREAVRLGAEALRAAEAAFKAASR